MKLLINLSLIFLLALFVPGESSPPDCSWDEAYKGECTQMTFYLNYMTNVTPGTYPVYPGKGYVDVDPDSPGFQWYRQETYYSVTAYENSPYLRVVSYANPTPGNPAVHSVNFRVKDSNNVVSDWGGFDLTIYNITNPGWCEEAPY